LLSFFDSNNNFIPIIFPHQVIPGQYVRARIHLIFKEAVFWS